MAITVEELRNQLDEIPDHWLIAAYEGEGIGLTAKSPDFVWGRTDNPEPIWIETGAPS